MPPRQIHVRKDPARGWTCTVLEGHSAEEPFSVTGASNDSDAVRRSVEAHLDATVVDWYPSPQPDGSVVYNGTFLAGGRDYASRLWDGNGWQVVTTVREWWRRRRDRGRADGRNSPPPPN